MDDFTEQGQTHDQSLAQEMALAPEKVAVLCVGNRLMMDEGIGPAVYDALLASYEIPEGLRLMDLGCMTLDQLPLVRDCDLIITVDAVDGSGEAAGTVLRWRPSDMMRRSAVTASLHDLKLADLFDAAILLGYESEGLCLGMQVENMEPAEYTMALTETCAAALPLLVETVRAELAKRGILIAEKEEHR